MAKAKKEEENFDYGAAMAEVDRILEQLNQEQVQIDQLAAMVRRGAELIEKCKTQLRATEEEVANLLKKE